MTNPITPANIPIEEPKKKPISKGVRIGILTLAVIAVAIFGIRWYIQLKTTVTTDNAKVSADLVSISAEVSGKLTDVYVQEGDKVEAGQLLAKLDASQYLISASQAEAAWELSKIAVTKLPNDIKSAQMSVAKAESALSAAIAQAGISKLAMEDCKRILDNNTALYQQGAVSKETLESCATKYETAVKTWEAANANVNAAQDSVSAAQAQLDTLNGTGSASYAAQEKQAKATYDNALLTLERTTVKSPISGSVVKVSALNGQNVSSGTSLFTIVNPERIWVLANIEEKKVARIHIGEKVNIVVDAYPNIVFDGQVEEIGGATQSSFSILPTENTAGNYTKVAQRLPVKISVVQQDNKLKPGMSAVVTIKTQ
ncbi:HlyD family secretion protein [Pelotomaculum terephthalicicum JT]|uniref:HlyD family secretion protein n=1 Tax=Pelotomaculum terephthalicicum TaxID=206393 RepID=UPI0009C7CCF7|nr:HlyD family secretion protein [Pelotomaculum terephthalicicum]MCG9967157.1 HlyD family secretion protein [Pelotomaculum terephthalicicum JT]OPY60014.1 MAG: putative multidrug resistance protein EmrK [Pelotomaculum sp. PtaU1.Bin065]